MSRMTDQIGRVMGGRYRLLSPLGSGASAQVYLADDVRLRRRVAVKVLHPALADDESFLRRFRAEAQSAASLSHPHLLAVYDWSGDGDLPFLVTEYLSGGSLRGLLDAGHLLSPAQALVVGLEAARALDHAHRQGFVHRDIKPANLLFGDDARLRVADFGLARAIAEAGWTEPTGAVLGTARYASPEQARGETVDGRSDVYSLALVMVEAVTGQVPFTADTTIGTLMARLDHPLDVPDELGPLVPVLTAAGRLDPDERLDAAGLGSGLVEAAVDLTRPAPLPLVGIGPVAIAPVDSRDTTLMAPSLHAPAGSGAPGVATALAPAVAGGVATANGAGATQVVHAGPGGASTVEASPGGPPPLAPSGPQPWRTGEHPRPGLSAGDRSARRLMLGAVIVVVAVTVGVVGAWLYIRAQVPSHTIPDKLIGMPRSELLDTVGGFGWTIDIEEVRQDGTEPDEIVATRPEPGERLREGETLTVVVSQGATLVPLPADLVGMTDDEAVAALEAAGLVAELVPTPSDDDDEGMVIGFADGDPGAEVPKGSTIRLAVSSGDEVEIPDVEGEPYASAVDQLESMGLEVVLEGEEPSDDRAVGEVIRTKPAAGKDVEPGSTVTVVVAVGRVEVPSVGGMSLDDATATVEGAGLTVGRVTGPDDGRVLASWPLETTEVDVGSSVDLIMRPGG
jgi:serine/threonine protein kinase/beta-lactam-binding protein with PASTA domain